MTCEPVGSSMRDVDRLVAAERRVPPPVPRRLDQQPAVAAFDGGLLGGLDVGGFGRVAGAHHHDGVGAVARGDPHVADDVDGHHDRVGGREGWHRRSPDGLVGVVVRAEVARAGPRGYERAHPVNRSPPVGLRGAVRVPRSVGSTTPARVRTSQELTERPSRPAASSIRSLSGSGRRSVTRDVPPSSPSPTGPPDPLGPRSGLGRSERRRADRPPVTSRRTRGRVRAGAPRPIPGRDRW